MTQVFETPASKELIRAFQQWERRNAARMLLRYAEYPSASAFGLRPSDVVTLNPHVRFELADHELRVVDLHGRCLAALGLGCVDLLRHFVAALDGQRTFAEICSQPPFAAHAEAWQAFVGNWLGGPFLLPAACAALERQLPAVELLRFPTQSPYAMPREYWENSVAVRQALERFYAGLGEPTTFLAGLRGLHRLATIGADGRNYYGGAGGVATVPGELRTGPIANRFDERRKWIVGHWLERLGVACELVAAGTIVSTNGVLLARIADGGRECHHAYERAGAQLASQLDELRTHLVEACAAVGTDRDRLLRHCALFHHTFAHAHPFGNINNSIAMNVVNDLLGRAGIGVLPHLFFDRAAFFMGPEDYVRLFERGVEAHVMNDDLGRDRAATAELLAAVA